MATYNSGAMYDSGVLYDATNPQVVSAAALDNTHVEVVFNDEMDDDANFRDPDSYVISGGLTVVSVTILSITALESKVLLQTSEQVDQTYTLVVSAALKNVGSDTMDPTGRAVTFSGIYERIQKLIRFLIGPLFEADRERAVADPRPGGRGLLERYLRGPQAIVDSTRERIESLRQQIDPINARVDSLQYLKDIVGFTSELSSITDRLTTTQLRRLIKLAVPLWKQRHTKAGIVNGIRLLTGRQAVLSDWFFFRFLLGESQLGEDQLVDGGDSWCIGGNCTLYDEYWSNVRVMDDGTLDELLLVDILRLMRPMGERIEVFLTDFLDHFFEENRDRWTQVSGTDWVYDSANLMMDLPDTGLVEPVIPILPASQLRDYAAVTKFRLATGGSLDFRWYVEAADTYYELTLDLNSPQFVLDRVVGGAPTNVFSGDSPLVTLVADADYKLRVQTLNDDAAPEREIKVFIDNNTIIDTTDGVLQPGWGPPRYKSNGATTKLTNIETWRIPGRYATIELGTLDEPGGELTMSDNFIQ